MIEVERLVKSFGRHRVLDEISLEIEPGERIALVGQNGSGKTTLIRCLLGLYKSSAGRVSVLGCDPRVDRQEVLAKVGFVPQIAPGIRSSVGEFLLATTRICGVELEPIVELAQNLGLSLRELSGRAFHALSGGMKQKLMISVALARRPRLLIMDEPAANLDPSARAAFFEELAKLRGDTTMLLSSHRIDEISGLVTRLVELDSGKVMLDDLVVVDHDAVGTRLACELSFQQIEAHVAKTLQEWGLQPDENVPNRWRGEISAADRFRFVCLIARWSGLVKTFKLEELP